MNYMIRTTPPETVAQSVDVFDEMVGAAVLKVLDVESLSSRSSAIVSLPLTLGGLGIRPQKRILPFAFEASKSGMRGAQHRDTMEVEVKVERTLVTTDKASAALLKSFQGESASAWLTAIGGNARLSRHLGNAALPTPAAARAHLRLRAQCEDGSDMRCMCGKDVGKLGFEHVFHCYLFSKTRTHDMIIRALSAILVESGVGHDTGLHSFTGDSRERPDMTLSLGLRRIAIDVTVVHAASLKYIAAASKHANSAVTKAELEKTMLLTELCRRKGFGFAPLAFETSGAIGKYSTSFLHHLASDIFTSKSDRRVWVAAAICRLQAAMINGHGGLRGALAVTALPRLAPPVDEVEFPPFPLVEHPRQTCFREHGTPKSDSLESWLDRHVPSTPPLDCVANGLSASASSFARGDTHDPPAASPLGCEAHPAADPGPFGGVDLAGAAGVEISC
jgi:hypothetical protein